MSESRFAEAFDYNTSSSLLRMLIYISVAMHLYGFHGELRFEDNGGK
jgi:hypothetical protein